MAIPITLTIRGAGWNETTIKPPAHPNSVCNSPGQVEGLCPVGALDSQGNPITSKPVVNVRILDLRLTGFSDSGVIGFNTKGLRVSDVKADHNGGYGIARFQSTNSVFQDNWASWNGEAGLYMGDSPHANSVLRDNKADHNGFGLFMRDSTNLQAYGNQTWGNCIGILALNSGMGAPGDLPAGNYTIAGNSSWANDKECPASQGQPALSGIGIALAGVHNTAVVGNRVRDNRPGGASLVSGGIVMISTKAMGGTNPTFNAILNNFAKHNKPADIVWDRTGFGNLVRNNNCVKAIPGNLGWCRSH